MSELTEISRPETHYPYSTSIASMSGFKNVKITDCTSFEQLSLITHISSVEETVERCEERCQAKIERAKCLTSKSFNL